MLRRPVMHHRRARTDSMSKASTIFVQQIFYFLLFILLRRCLFYLLLSNASTLRKWSAQLDPWLNASTHGWHYFILCFYDITMLGSRSKASMRGCQTCDDTMPNTYVFISFTTFYTCGRMLRRAGSDYIMLSYLIYGSMIESFEA